ncbi:MFS transporter [Escherichia coli]|nr:MFS transporter [Escherichia coli]
MTPYKLETKPDRRLARLFSYRCRLQSGNALLTLYVEQLGVTGHSALNMWSGIVFSITFLFSAIASPFWGGLADRKGRKLMLLRSALGMGIVMVLMGLAQNIWQF